MVGRLPALPADEARAPAPLLPAARTRRAYLGRWMEMPVHQMDRLPTGQEIKGPAIFESATTTVVIRAEERALVTAQGWLDIAIE